MSKRRIAIFDRQTGSVLQELEGPERHVQAAILRLPATKDFLDLEPGVVATGRRVLDGQIVDAKPSVEAALKAIRMKRDQLLGGCDWTQASDAPVNRNAWAKYRQALRDITETTDPHNPIWPTPPNAKKGTKT